jgi:hypothetical protein
MDSEIAFHHTSSPPECSGVLALSGKAAEGCRTPRRVASSRAQGGPQVLECVNGVKSRSSPYYLQLPTGPTLRITKSHSPPSSVEPTVEPTLAQGMLAAMFGIVFSL